MAEAAAKTDGAPIRVGLFVTCLVDLFRPSVGFATVKLLEDAGCVVEAPAAQTCCGQPAWNSGDAARAQGIAKQVIEAFEACDYVVAPSGSCAGTIRKDYPEMLRDDATWRPRAEALAAKTFEIVGFLHDVRGVRTTGAAINGAATYHHSCSSLRSMEVEAQPLALLNAVDGLDVVPLRDSNVCCGFGGAFCVKYPDISNRMVEQKSEAIAETGADLILAGDLGCLMNIAGKLQRQGRPVRARHIAEVLAGMTDHPAIGEKA